MNVSSLSSSGVYQTQATKPVAALNASTATSEATQPSKAAGPLFSGGLINWNAVMTPETLGAIFALNAQGEVQFQDNGAPMVGPNGVPATSRAGLVIQHVKEIHAQQVGDKSGYRVNATDEQKRFFHDVTGYNLVTEDGGFGVYDDEGNLVPETGPNGGQASAVWQLAGDIADLSLENNGQPIGPDGQPRTSGTSIDSDWFQKWTEKMGAGSVKLPAEWLARAREHFDTALNVLFENSDDSKKKQVTIEHSSSVSPATES